MGEIHPELSTGADAALPTGMEAARWRDIVQHARATGSEPLDIAIAEGHVNEAAFMVELASLLGVSFAPVPPTPVSAKPLDRMASLRSYPARDAAGRECQVIAPNATIAALLQRQSTTGKLPPIILTTHQALIDAIIAARRDEIAVRAITGLSADLSAQAGSPASSSQRWANAAVALAVSLALATLAYLFPLQMMVLPPLMLAPVFMLAALAVLTAAVESLRPDVPSPRLAMRDLPRYSVLVPLYRESNIVGDLVGYLARIDYPRDRIEIFLLVEEDDGETRQALAGLRLPGWFRVLAVPPGEPRTKPRALNAALPFCTGDCLVIYDAEDHPEPDQLLRAAARFRTMPPDVACLQARLGISNSYDGFLTRRFAIDYAALFDCIKSGSARAGWAVPLGGSSNHFRGIM